MVDVVGQAPSLTLLTHEFLPHVGSTLHAIVLFDEINVKPNDVGGSMMRVLCRKLSNGMVVC